VGSVLSIMFAVPFTAFYARTPQKLMGRVGSLGAATGALFGALSSLGFGWLIQTVSAPSALLGCAFIMGSLALAFTVMPFVRLLDRPQEAEAESKAETAPPPAA
ncbi:MAG TPA: hypothetical protein VFT59_03695, partial [Candidatus Saccharimonadales bacterium]|nr:hypothetical protein [Candidatus Saccharimonadales bacterium]